MNTKEDKGSQVYARKEREIAHTCSQLTGTPGAQSRDLVLAFDNIEEEALSIANTLGSSSGHSS